MSIRGRLLLLVLAVWLPAAAGLALLARSLYEREAAAARDQVRQQAVSMNFIVEREFDKRATLATALAASNAARDNDLARLHEEASAATQGSANWITVVDADSVILSTQKPFDPLVKTGPPRARAGKLTVGDPMVIYVPKGPVAHAPVIAVLARLPREAAPVHNVVVSFAPDVIQSVIAQQPAPPGGLATIIDGDQLIMARSRDPEKWLGMSITGELKRRATARGSGYADTVTLDGVPSLTYLTPPNRYGWAVAISIPQATLAATARRVTEQALSAAAILLAIGLALAIYGARKVSETVDRLRDAAAELGNNRVPPRVATGVPEFDAVGAALHASALKSQEATRTLERRVEAAVEQARQSQAKLLDGQKHEAIGRLTGGIAHDFNNLLQTITTALQVLNKRTTGEGPERRVLEGAMRASTKAADLIKQLLTFGRAQALKPQPIVLPDLLLKSVELTSKAVGERIALTASIAPGLPPVFVDPVQLELALLNLIFNARDAMPDGGRIAITGRMAHDDERTNLAPGPFICLEVADDGHGMSPQTAARAFEPYFTTKPVGAGSGLGLAQAKEFAEQSGGGILLASTVGQGTRVSLLLPCANGRAPAPPPQDEQQPAVPHVPLRVLMVEDDVLVSSVVVPALQGEGHTVTLCNSADAAVEVLGDGQPFDVVFTDVVMPGKRSGFDLARWCETARPGLPVLVTTGYAAQQPDSTVPVLRKPYAIDALLAAMQRAVRG